MGTTWKRRSCWTRRPSKRVRSKPLKRAFDEVWSLIAPSVDPASVENARLSLAHAIVAHAGLLGTENLEALKAAARAGFEKRS